MIQLLRSSGTEGSRHDPYGYTEFTVVKENKTITLHAGLRCFIKVDGRLHFRATYSGYEDALIHRIFSILIGFPVEKFDRYYDRIRLYCTRCGNHKRHYYADGFPGETMVMCAVCDTPVDSWVNWSAIE